MSSNVTLPDSRFLLRWNKEVPRYTSYPTAPHFYPITEEVARERLKRFDQSQKPLSLYMHIPFCKTMCLFCGCSVVLNRRPERQRKYLELLLEEIRLVSRNFSSRKKISELHLGGGTPTSLSEEEFLLLMEALQRHFIFTEEAQLAIEVDPRTVFADQGKKLKFLRSLGFNRISFGVQDMDPKVQEAIKRRQSQEMTEQTYQMARELSFQEINLDLIYGLPLQTATSFRKTTQEVIRLQPDRISFFSYAKIPWLKKHQKAIREEDLPSTEEKLQIYLEAREAFLEAGYRAIGMDHFAKKESSLAIAYEQGTLHRNFQGYCVQRAEDLLGFGVTAIGFVEGAFLQNVKTIEEYESRIQSGKWPVFRGFCLKKEDELRRWVIQQWMCRFKVDKKEFKALFQVSFDSHFAKELERLEELKQEGLITSNEQVIQATSKGEIFIRLIASHFDSYLSSQNRFSRLI